MNSKGYCTFLLLCVLLCLARTFSALDSDSINIDSPSETVQISSQYIPDNCIRKIKNGEKVSIHYTGKIHESTTKGIPGKIFENSRETGKPLKFTLGSKGYIPGLSIGMDGMCVGEKRSIIIPPILGYGNKGSRGIPGGATLQFDVELLEIVDPTAKKRTPNIFIEMDGDDDGRISYEEMAYWFANSHPQHLEKIPTGVWEKDDKNRDGFVSWEEFSGPKGIRRDL